MEQVKIFSVKKIVDNNTMVEVSQAEFGLPKLSIRQIISSSHGINDLSWSQWGDICEAAKECRQELIKLFPEGE